MAAIISSMAIAMALAALYAILHWLFPENVPMPALVAKNILTPYIGLLLLVASPFFGLMARTFKRQQNKHTGSR
jgi:hypothetical protein